MSEELKPCPFCGGEAMVWPSLTGLTYHVSCCKCYANNNYRSTEAKAIDAWNHRATTTTHAIIVSDKSTDCATGYCRCELCGEPIDQWDNFCRHCGARCVG